ncbi:helix-turn-helix domain-containing protein [Klebsiella pneumoniae]
MNKEMELLRIFRVAAESSSFRDAAVRLGTSPQGVTRAIQQLEQHYGEVLFHRSTRQVRITAFGEGLLDCQWPLILTHFWPIELTHLLTANRRFSASNDSSHLPA